MKSRTDVVRNVPRCAAAIFFVVTGANHFLHPAFYLAIMPPWLPAPAALVAISGACEIAGGLGLLVPRLRVPAAWSLLGLLIAVLPANVHMAMHADRMPTLGLPTWTLWLRIPLQLPLLGWVWWVALAPEARRQPHSQKRSSESWT